MSRPKNTGEMVVRPAVRGDLDDMVRIDSECFVPPTGRDGISSMMIRRGATGYVVEHRGQVVGFCIRLRTRWYDLLETLAVSGIGQQERVTQMLCDAMKSGMGRDQRFLVTDAPSDPPWAIRMLSDNGFRAVRSTRGGKAYRMVYSRPNG